MSSPDFFTRREPLADYLGNRAYRASSELRRFARHGAVVAPDVTGFPGSMMGEALHAYILEPEAFEAQYLVLDGSVPAGGTLSEGEALRRDWLDAWQWVALRKAREAILASPQAPVADWLARGEKELSIYWTDSNGDNWKARPDCFTADCVVELKSTIDCRPEAFRKTRERMAYDLQAAHYLDAVTQVTGRSMGFAYVTVELASPYSAWIHRLSDEELARAAEQLARVRAEFVAALAVR